MRLIDCFMYFDEDMLLDIRLNILNKHVSKFIICEANYNHNGENKKIKFDIQKFKKFKDKIIFLPLDKQPNNLVKIENKLNTDIDATILDNALKRENFQRNYLSKGIEKFDEEDLICISDIDEIPNLENFKYKKKITIFQHEMFYYKLNLKYPDFLWTGSKICKKKHLISPQWLRNIKTKIYPLWRLDIIFSQKKYNNISVIHNGGWHFTNIKSAEKIHHKMMNFLHHLEYEESGLNVSEIEKKIEGRKILYDYRVDQRQNKWNSEIKLEVFSLEKLPNYISENSKKFKEWLV